MYAKLTFDTSMTYSLFLGGGDGGSTTTSRLTSIAFDNNEVLLGGLHSDSGNVNYAFMIKMSDSTDSIAKSMVFKQTGTPYLEVTQVGLYASDNDYYAGCAESSDGINTQYFAATSSTFSSYYDGDDSSNAKSCLAVFVESTIKFWALIAVYATQNTHYILEISYNGSNTAKKQEINDAQGTITAGEAIFDSGKDDYFIAGSATDFYDATVLSYKTGFIAHYSDHTSCNAIGSQTSITSWNSGNLVFTTTDNSYGQLTTFTLTNRTYSDVTVTFQSLATLGTVKNTCS